MASIEEDLATRLARGEEVVMATVVAAEGDPPSHPGAKILLAPTGLLAGTLGCSEFDAAALADVPAALQEGVPRLARYTHDLGSVEVYMEPYPERPTLVIAGATPVAEGLLGEAGRVGFRTLLVESRAVRMGRQAWPADAVLTELGTLDQALAGNGALYAVVTDHDSPDVVPLCALLLPRQPRFLGLMGSRRHTSRHLEALRLQGFTDEQLRAIRTPVGLSLGGRSAAEIALSIAAGLVAVRRGGSGGWLDAPPAGS